MKKSEGIFQKLFGSIGSSSSRIPLRSNIYRGSAGYSQIGSTGRWSGGQSERKSPLLGTSSPSNLLSGYYERIDELRGYSLIDIVKLATNFYVDYIINFLEDSNQKIVTILQEDDDNTVDETKTDRLNEILVKDLKLFDHIKDHAKDYVQYGQYGSLLCRNKDEFGHFKFRFEELYDPISIITKKSRNEDGEIEETYLARGEDGKIYEIGGQDAFVLGNINLRLINDLEEKEKKDITRPTPTFGKQGPDNLSKIIKKCSFSVGEPLFYSLILKVKELIIKELLVSLISLRDLSSVQIFLLQFDKSTPMETANELCARTTKLANTTNELASFLTSQFDITSFIENSLSQSAKFVPDYNSTVGNKNNLLPLDKLSDKLIDMLQSLDTCRNNILSPLGIPSTILDSTSGSKWAILQQSERANSRVSNFMIGIKDSVMNITCTIYKILYGETLDPSRVRLHVSEKTSVEYNNQINQSESINGLMTGISQIISNAIQTLDQAAPLIDSKAFLNYLQNLIKDIDPETESLINDDTINAYVEFAKAKLKSQAEQLGVEDPSIFFPPEDKEKMI